MFRGNIEPLGKRSGIFNRSPVHLLVLIALVVIVYSNTFHSPFVFDDQSSISENPVIRDVGNFFTNGRGYAYNPRRYVCYLTFALNYQLGKLDVTGFHIVNLAIHLINCLLVYALVLVTSRTQLLRSSANSFPVRWVALFTSLLFAVHPIETQAVTYIVQRLTSLMSLFYLLALLLYARSRVIEEDEGWRWKSVMPYLLALVSIVLAMKSKENAFTLPIAILLYEWLFFNGPVRKRLLRLIPILATLLIIPLSMLDIHKPLGDVISDVSQVTQVKPLLSRWEYLFTQFRVIVTYLRLLVLPVNQTLDYDYPYYHSMFAPQVLASLLLLLAIFATAVWLLYHSKFSVEKNSTPLSSSFASPYVRLISFGIFWFFLTLAVESSIIPITDVIYEHRVYLPSVGAFLAAVTALALVSMRVGDKGRKIIVSGAAAVIAILAVATFQRNNVWGDNVTLWEDVVRKSPAKVRGYNNLGAALSDANRQDEAIAVLKKALQIKPDHPEAYYNLGRIYLLQSGDLNDAIFLLSRAIALKPDYDNAYINLAAAYIKAGNPALAIKLLKSTTPIARDRADRHFNLGVAYTLLGNIGEAEKEVEFLREIDPMRALQLQDFMTASSGRKP